MDADTERDVCNAGGYEQAAPEIKDESMLRVLRCYDHDAAIRALGQAFGQPRERMRTAIVEAARIARGDPNDPIGAIAPALAKVVGKQPSVERIVYFHGSRVRDPEQFIARGIRPLAEMIDEIWVELRTLAPECSNSSWSRLRCRLEQGLEPHTYSLRLGAPELLGGPNSLLVREMLLCPAEFSSGDFLTAPEIVADICSAVEATHGFDLLGRFQEQSVPVVVEFVMPPTHSDRALAAACWYVEAGFEGKTTSLAAWGYDGHGVSVSPSAVLAARAEDGSGRVWCSSV